MKQITYLGPIDPASPVTAVQVTVDATTHDFPRGVPVTVANAIADRLTQPDLAEQHTFTITDPDDAEPQPDAGPASKRKTTRTPTPED